MSRDNYNTAGSRKMITSTITMLLLLSSLFGLFSAVLPERVAGITVPGGTLAENTRWRVSDSPVILEGNVTVPSGVTLTIDPGVTVLLPPSAGIWVEGKLVARGTEASPIALDKSHASFYFDGINVTGGGYGIIEHLIMTGSAGGVKAMGSGSRAFVYNSTLMGNSAGFRGSSGAYAWLVNCTFNAPVNATAATSAEVHEGKWFFFKAISDMDLSGISGATVKISGEKYPTELEEWTVFDSAAKEMKTDDNGDMQPIAVNQYKHNGQTSSVRVEITMRWELSEPASYWRYDIKDPGLFVGDNFNLTWYVDKTPPPMPENLRIGNRTGTTIELLWDLPNPPTDLRWFNIRYKRTNEPLSAMRYVNADDSVRSIVIDSLTHDSLWEFSIMSEDFYANSLGNTSSVIGKTLDIVPPEPPRNFTLKDFGGDWAQFKWNPSPSDDVVGFWIFIKDTYGSWNMSKYIDSHMVATDKVTGLPSQTNLTAWIVSVDDAETPNIGPSSSKVFFTTLDITPPVAPRLEFFPLESEQYIPGSLYFNTSLVGFKVNVTGEDRTVIEIKLDGKDFVDPDGIIRWTTYGGVFQYYFFLDEGKHNAMFRSIDPSDNAGPYNSSDIWVDLTPPEMFLEGYEGDNLQFYEGEAVDLTLNITDNNDIDDVLWTVSNNYTYEEVHGTRFVKDLDIGSYLLTIKAFDIAGNWNYQEYTMIVSVPDLTPPGIISNYPEDGEVNVELGPLISVRFSELVRWDSLTPSLTPQGGSAVPLRSNLDLDNRTISFYSEDSLLGGTNYTFILRSIMDLSGNEAPDLVIHFRTISEEDIDTDGDGIPDVYELQYDFLSPSDNTDAAEDYDKDGLTNLQEYQLGTEPDNPDTDDDGIPDGKEVEWGLNPRWASDAQGDLDGDGYSNLEEYEKGSDPTDIESVPEVSENGSQLWLVILIVVILVVIFGAAIAALIYFNKKKGKEEETDDGLVPSIGTFEEPTWSEMEELHKKECPFCKASLEEGMTYCPECGMDLPEDKVEEGSMDEDIGEDLSIGTPPDEISVVGGGEVEPPERDLGIEDEDLESEMEEEIEPPTMDEGP